jgi:hypothetical protein
MAKLKKYVREFPYYIARDYGPKEKYDLAVIESIFTKYKFPEKGKHYAYVMFSDEKSFQKLFDSYSEIKSYNHYREEIAEKFFGGISDFKFIDLIKKTRYLRCVTVIENSDGTYEYDIRDSPDSAMGAGY